MMESVLPTNARELALRVLKRVERDNAYLDRLVDYYQNRAGLNPKERGLFKELSYGVIRQRRLLDFYLEQVLDRRIERTDLTTRVILRIGAYQILFLDRIPAPSAVDEAVKLSAAYAKPLVNAVLRRLSENKNMLRPPDEIPERILRLSVKYSHPDWIVNYAINELGEEAEEFLSANNQKPSLTLRVNSLKISREELLELLRKEGVKAEPGKFSPLAVVIQEPEPVRNLPGFDGGLFAVQDEASQLVVFMLAPGAGDKILDACSAPGTKSLMLFQMMKKDGKVFCADINQTRLNLIKAEAKRLGLEGCECFVQDLTLPMDFGKKGPNLFDKILLDAPCSGLGTLRKHPEIKWQKKPSDIISLSSLQKSLIKNLSRHLKRGGVLVYSTCTWTKEENQDVVNELMATKEFELEDAREFLPEPAKSLVQNKVLKTFPHRHSTDAFTAFRLRKR